MVKQLISLTTVIPLPKVLFQRLFIICCMAHYDLVLYLVVHISEMRFSQWNPIVRKLLLVNRCVPTSAMGRNAIEDRRARVRLLEANNTYI